MNTASARNSTSAEGLALCLHLAKIAATWDEPSDRTGRGLDRDPPSSIHTPLDNPCPPYRGARTPWGRQTVQSQSAREGRPSCISALEHNPHSSCTPSPTSPTCRPPWQGVRGRLHPTPGPGAAGGLKAPGSSPLRPPADIYNIRRMSPWSVGRDEIFNAVLLGNAMTWADCECHAHGAPEVFH